MLDMLMLLLVELLTRVVTFRDIGNVIRYHQHKDPCKLEQLIDVIGETVLILLGTAHIVSLIPVSACVLLTLVLFVPKDERHKDCGRSQQSPSAPPCSL